MIRVNVKLEIMKMISETVDDYINSDKYLTDKINYKMAAEVNRAINRCGECLKTSSNSDGACHWDVHRSCLEQTVQVLKLIEVKERIADTFRDMALPTNLIDCVNFMYYIDKSEDILKEDIFILRDDFLNNVLDKFMSTYPTAPRDMVRSKVQESFNELSQQ